MTERFYLEFDDRTGTDRELFATFRLHLAWAKRLKRRRIILLADTKTRTVFGQARVEGLQAGKAKDILGEWGWLSHLEEELCRPPLERKPCAALRRFQSMQKRYGPHRFNENSNITAIILKRTK